MSEISPEGAREKREMFAKGDAIRLEKRPMRAGHHIEGEGEVVYGTFSRPITMSQPFYYLVNDEEQETPPVWDVSIRGSKVMLTTSDAVYTLERA